MTYSFNVTMLRDVFYHDERILLDGTKIDWEKMDSGEIERLLKSVELDPEDFKTLDGPLVIAELPKLPSRHEMLLAKLPNRHLRSLYMAYVDANRARHNWYSRRCHEKRRADTEEQKLQLRTLADDKIRAGKELRAALKSHRSGLTVVTGDCNQIVDFMTKSEVRKYKKVRKAQNEARKRQIAAYNVRARFTA